MAFYITLPNTLLIALRKVGLGYEIFLILYDPVTVLELTTALFV